MAEDRSQCNNLRLVGIPEGAEKNDITAFLNKFISMTLGTDPPLEGNRDGPRSQDRLKAGIRVFRISDYSKEMQKKQEAFSHCKRALHERKIKFGMLYPARLKIFISGNSSQVFDNPEKVMEYIQSSFSDYIGNGSGT